MRERKEWNEKQRLVGQWLDALNHPEASLRVIHIVGTNGKGSTGTAIAVGLRDFIRKANEGKPGRVKPVGHFLSPHVHRYNERILLDETPISDEKLQEVRRELQAVKEAFSLPEPEYFQQSLLEALLAFRDCRWAIIEAGVGGREDVTNLLPSEMVVITTISEDHLQTLGPTIQDIARHKAGVIVPGHPVISCNQRPEVARIISEICARRKAPLVVYHPESMVRPHLRKVREEAPRFRMGFTWTEGALAGDYELSMIGLHQLQNMGTALLALECLSIEDPKLVAHALAEIQVPGRMEEISTAPDIWIDGAHNPQAVDILLANLKWLQIEEPNLIFGMHEGKINAEKRQELFAACRKVVHIRVEEESDAAILEELSEALDTLNREDPERPIIVCGSLYILDGAQRWVRDHARK